MMVELENVDVSFHKTGVRLKILANAAHMASLAAQLCDGVGENALAARFRAAKADADDALTLEASYAASNLQGEPKSPA